MKINKKNIRKWVNALRSGKYQQGAYALRNESDGVYFYCCLGVACELSKLGQWRKVPGHSAYKYAGSVDFLPKKVADWLGLEWDDPILTTRTASELNDSGSSFKRIAYYIERKYLK